MFSRYCRSGAVRCHESGLANAWQEAHACATSGLGIFSSRMRCWVKYATFEISSGASPCESLGSTVFKKRGGVLADEAVMCSSTWKRVLTGATNQSPEIVSVDGRTVCL